MNLAERREHVSSPNENLILVDSHDRELGEMSKLDCHLGDGTLHRAFSVFIFNSAMEELAAMRFIGINELSAELENNTGDYTPWFKMEWLEIQSMIDQCGGSIDRFLEQECQR